MGVEQAEGTYSVDAALVGHDVKLTIWHSTDRGPAKRFGPIQTIRLDFAQALDLYGSLTEAMRAQAGLHREVTA